MNQPKAIDIKQLNIILRSNHTKILDDISFSLEAGEWLSVIGASGSGKSMLLKSLIGLAEPKIFEQNGVITVDNKVYFDGTTNNLSQLPGRHIGLIAQEPLSSLNPIMRIEKQIRESQQFLKHPPNHY